MSVPAPAAARHRAKLDRIAAQLRAATGDKPLSLRKKAVAHQVPKAGDLRRRDAKIDVSDLTDILLVDPAKKICVAESGVTFVDLVAATLAHGLVPIVVPELKTITIGGAVSGCSIESMSFVRGGFHDTCRAYEVITAAGDVIECTPDNEHAMVFQMVHGSFGTLGILAALTFELVPAKPFVHLIYETHKDIASYQRSIEAHAAAHDVDFMDGIIHASDCYVLSLGHFVEAAPYTSNYEWLKVYYKSTKTRKEDYLSTPDYFFRYDRGVTNVRPNSFLGRLLFGKFLSSTQWLTIADKLNFALKREKPTVTLDVFVPMSKVPAFLAWWEQEFGFYPLWAVPYKRVHDYEWMVDSFWQGLEDTMFLDIAIYGMAQKDERNAHRMIEEKLRELGGIKTLISHNYYGEAEFWEIFNKPNYDAAKAVTDPKNRFRDLYTKTCKAAMGLT